MKIVLSIIFLAIVWVTLVSSQTTTKAPSIPSFDAYKKTFNKKYADTKTTKSGKTEEQAKQAYANAVQRINKHNSQKNRTYTRSVNPMSDLTAKEFKSQKTGYNYTQVKSSLKNAQSRYSSKSNNKNYKSSGTSFPTSAFKKFDPVQGGYNSTKVSAQMRILKQSLKGNLDLRPKMSAVRNQEQCGSCWAFAAVAVLEYESNIAGTNLDLSEQHLVDCETNSFGCDGGSPLNALLFAYAKGVALESNVPYKAVKGTCASPTPLTKIPNVCFLLEGSEAYLFYIMNKFNKPVVVGIE
jgi:C1A family cysteine protease